jgi:hypothetical protein
VATFDLRVSMTGLGLFATQESTKQLHFLMPSSDSASGTHEHAGHDHLHMACIFANAAYLQPNSPSEILNSVVPFMIGGHYVDFSALGGDQTQDPANQLPPELLNLGELSNSYVQWGLVSEDPGDLVASRVTISKGDLECYEPGARWHVTAAAPSIHHMAWLLTWQVSGVETEADGGFQLRPIEFATGAVMQVPRLYPTTDNNRIHIWAMYLPPDQMPPFGPKPAQIAWGAEPPHLHIAYKLLGPSPRWPTIRYLDNVNDGQGCHPRWPSDRRDTPPAATAPSTHHHAVSPTGGAAFGDEWTCAGARAEVR